MGIPLLELQERVSSREFSLYMARYEMDPWGTRRADVNAAIVAQTIATAHTGREFPLDDFIPSWGRQEPESDEHMLAKMMTFSKSHNEAVSRQKD